MTQENKIGRPSTYSQEITDTICLRLAGGESLLSICQDDDMPAQRTVFQWLSKHKEFVQKYAAAREAWADAEFERMMEIADEPVIGIKTVEKFIKGEPVTETISGDMVERARLQIDTRKWALARMSPRKYSEKSFQGALGADGQPIDMPKMSDAQIAAALTAITNNQPIPVTDASVPDDLTDLV